MDGPSRRQWNRPEVTVLVRRRPEEAVLTACKLVGSGQSEASVDIGCLYYKCKPDCASVIGS